MKILIAFGLFCLCLIASHIEKNSFEIKNEKTDFENLSDGPVHEIMSHLDQEGKEQLSKTSKEFFRFDPRRVDLNLPLKNSKRFTPFVCEHLKIRKNLQINLNYELGDLFEPDSLSMKYLKCLSGIETITFNGFNVETKLLGHHNFKLQEFFPKVKHLDFSLKGKINWDNIPNTLKSMRMFYAFDYNEGTKLLEKIGQMKQLKTLTLDIFGEQRNDVLPLLPMIAELKKLPNFKKLTISFKAGALGLRGILIQTKHAKYSLNLSTDISFIVRDANFYEYLPEKTESLELKFYSFENKERFCNALATLNHLKELRLISKGSRQNFDCLLSSLPTSLTRWTFIGKIENSDTSQVNLPKNLQYASLHNVNSKVFEFLANHVPVLKLDISDLENLLTIKKPFTRVKSLALMFIDYHEAYLHLLDLLPMDMDYVHYGIFLDEEEFKLLEEKIMGMKNQIKKFEISFISSTNGRITREYYYDGTKMTRN